MSETWYQLSRYADTVVPVEVVSRTDRFVTLKNRTGTFRKAIWGDFFPTFEEARQAGIRRSETMLMSAQGAVKRAEKSLKVFQDLQEKKI